MSKQESSKAKSTRAERLKQAAQERREREKQELRRAILDAAGELFLEHGYEGFSLRQVAEAIGYSPGTIYLYFKDKDAVLFSVADEGFNEFGRRIAGAFHSTDDPAERLRTMGRAYIDFALKNRAYYELMFMQRADYLAKRRGPEFKPPIDSLHVLQDAVRAAMEAGVIREGDVKSTADVIWALMHGVVALIISMPFMFDEERTEKVVETALTWGLNSFQS